MIPCSKLTDRWGRKRCLIGGLALFGVGALLSAIAPGLGVLIVGNSILEGVGTALLIPPVYILATLWFTDTTSRAWAFGAISGMGGVGAAAGPLIGGVIATWIDWRAAFLFQALVVAVIILLSRNLGDPLPADPTRPFDVVGAVLSAVGMFFIVFGILQAGVNNALFVGLVVVSWFYQWRWSALNPPHQSVQMIAYYPEAEPPWWCIRLPAQWRFSKGVWRVMDGPSIKVADPLIGEPAGRQDLQMIIARRMPVNAELDGRPGWYTATPTRVQYRVPIYDRMFELTLDGDELIGVAIISRALEEPMRWIATNAGHEGPIVVQRVREMNADEGFNAQTERYEDLVQAGVIDPTKVVRSALQNAASIASLLLTTETVISQIPEAASAVASAAGGMGGMY